MKYIIWRIILDGVPFPKTLVAYWIDEYNFLHIASGAVNVTVHHDCGCTLMKMTHDISTVGLLQNRTKTNFSSDKLYDGVNLFNGDGVLLIRNPFEAIITYYNYSRTAMSARHYDEGIWLYVHVH